MWNNSRSEGPREMKPRPTPTNSGTGSPTVSSLCLCELAFRRYGQKKHLFWLYLGKSHRLVVGAVGKLVVELCVTEVGSKSLGRSVRELLARKRRSNQKAAASKECPSTRGPQGGSGARPASRGPPEAGPFCRPFWVFLAGKNCASVAQPGVFTVGLGCPVGPGRSRSRNQ